MAGKNRGRNPSFELLRVLSMGMVILLHCAVRTGTLMSPAEPFTARGVMADAIESLCIGAVNIYVLLSGYFLCRQKVRLSRMITLWLQVFFYSAGIPVVLRLLGLPLKGSGLYGLAGYLLPISTGHYWFATAYLQLLVLGMILIPGIERLTAKQHKVVMVILLALFCLLPGLCPVQLVTDNAGYDVLWFVVLFVVAAYLRRQEEGKEKDQGRRGLYLYLASSTGILVLRLLTHAATLRTGGLLTYAEVPFHYNTPLCLAAAVGLFTAFRHLTISPDSLLGRAALRLAPCTFGVYLLHEHMDLRDLWAPLVGRITGLPGQGPLTYLLSALVSAVLLFGVCALIERGRIALFALLVRPLGRTALWQQVLRVDSVLAGEGEEEGRKHA